MILTLKKKGAGDWILIELKITKNTKKSSLGPIKLKNDINTAIFAVSKQFFKNCKATSRQVMYIYTYQCIYTYLYIFNNEEY